MTLDRNVTGVWPQMDPFVRHFLKLNFNSLKFFIEIINFNSFKIFYKIRFEIVKFLQN